MYIVDEYFDGKLVKEHKFFTYERAYDFYQFKFEATKRTYYVRYKFRGLDGISK